jgi:hypothetical protein
VPEEPLVYYRVNLGGLVNMVEAILYLRRAPR